MNSARRHTLMMAIGARLAFAAMLAQLGLAMLCCAAGGELFAESGIAAHGAHGAIDGQARHILSGAHHANGPDEACPVCETLCTFAAVLFAALIVAQLSLAPAGRLKVAIVSSRPSHRCGALFQSRAPPSFV